MDKKSIISKLQTVFGVSASEMIFVILLISGLLLGSAYKMISPDDEGNKDNIPPDELYRLLDSLAEAQKTTYIGTDISGKSVPELAEGDTIVEDDLYYPKAKKKEKPVEKIDINSASLTELMTLPGVGESTARKIIDQRERTLFSKADDLLKVKGIGKKKLDALKDYIEIK